MAPKPLNSNFIFSRSSECVFVFPSHTPRLVWVIRAHPWSDGSFSLRVSVWIFLSISIYLNSSVCIVANLCLGFQSMVSPTAHGHDRNIFWYQVFSPTSCAQEREYRCRTWWFASPDTVFHTYQCSLHVSYWYRQNALQQILSCLSISETKNDSFATFTWHNEVAFHVAQTPSFVDFTWSFVDHALVRYAWFQKSRPTLLLEDLRSMGLNLASVRALDEPAYRWSWSIRDTFLNPLQTKRDVLGWLIVEKVRFYEWAEIRIESDCSADCPTVFPAYVWNVLRVFRVIRSSFSLLLYLVPNDILSSTECFSNVIKCIFLCEQNLYLIPLAFREVLSTG